MSARRKTVRLLGGTKAITLICLAASLVMNCTLPKMAVAAEAAPPRDHDDFDPANDGWNGLGYLLETAREANVTADVQDTLDWSELAADDVLFVIAPLVGPGPNALELSRFIRAGGRVIIADDFRAGAAWMAPFGLQLMHRAGPANQYAAGIRYLPKLDGDAELGEFLGYHVGHVVLNHPAAIVATEVRGWRHRSLGRFSDRVRAWAMEAYRPGQQGKVLALSDPSLLINAMTRRFYGNKQMSANLLRYFCFDNEPCRVRVLANLKEVHGTYRGGGSGGLSRNVRRIVHQWVEGLSNTLSNSRLRHLWWLLAVLALVWPIYTAARMPGPRLPALLSGPGGEGRLRRTVRAWLSQPDADYRRPARQLAHHLTRMVTNADERLAQTMGGVSAAPLELPETIESLVGNGQISEAAGRRILDLVGVLQEVADRAADPVDRERFTQLAAEVDWAEQVLSHTSAQRRVS